MKESADYKKVKSILRSKRNIKWFNRLLNRHKFDHKSFNLNKAPMALINALINVNKIKICRYIERLYLSNEFDEIKLKKLLYIHSRISIIYFKNLPLRMYQEYLYEDYEDFKFISSNTKCYDEIKQMYGYLTI